MPLTCVGLDAQRAELVGRGPTCVSRDSGPTPSQRGYTFSYDLSCPRELVGVHMIMWADCRRPRLVGVSCASMDRVSLRMPGVTMLPAVLDVAAEGSMVDFEVGYVAEDRGRLIRRVVKVVEDVYGEGVRCRIRCDLVGRRRCGCPRSRLPHPRLLDVNVRMELAAAGPVTVPDTIVIDGRGVRVRDVHPGLRPVGRLGAELPPRNPDGQGHRRGTTDAINTLFCRHAAACIGSDTQFRGGRVDAQVAWTVPDLQDLLDEWLLCGWQARQHDAPRDPYLPISARRAVNPVASIVEEGRYVSQAPVFRR